MSFQKIYGSYGLEHHTVEINGDVTMRTDGQTNKQVKIELLSLWTVWDWVSQKALFIIPNENYWHYLYTMKMINIQKNWKHV